jgi:hypothetical protein
MWTGACSCRCAPGRLSSTGADSGRVLCEGSRSGAIRHSFFCRAPRPKEIIGVPPVEGEPMREQEMRMRVFRFLKARMRNMIMPATVGIGLAMGGCAKEGALTEAEDAGTPHTDVLGPDSQALGPDQAAPGPDQAAPGPDLAVPGTDQAVPGPDLGSQEPDAQILADGPPDLARDILSDPVPVYGDGFGVDLLKLDAADAPTPDAAVPADEGVASDGAGIDSDKDLGSITVKYIAPIPDAAADTGTVVALYTAQTPDAGVPRDGLAVRYMAQLPDA